MERYFGLKKIKINTLKTFGRRLFTYHRGKIIGSLVGLLTGLRLFGLLFGLLFGSLVDTIIEHYRLQREVELFEGKGKLSKTPAGRVAAAAICALETADSAKRTITGLDAYGTAADGAGGGTNSAGRKPDSAVGVAAGILDAQEVELVKRQIARNFALSASGKQAVKAVRPGGSGGEVFEALMSSEISFDDVSEQFALMQSLFESASLFGPVPRETRELIERIREAFGVSPETARFADLIYSSRDTESYRILGLQPGAPESEIKRVYRELAVQFHPDSLHSLEPHQRKTAEEAFLKIRRAYESIMKGHPCS
ncbi:MAG: DnaJ domain-containing protein [Spirochaetia bacterium]